MLKRGPYKTKKRKEEFRKAYEEIGDLNCSIFNMEIEKDYFLRAGDLVGVQDRSKKIDEMKTRLAEMEKQGWDIEYTSPQVSGYGVTPTYPELS